METSPTFNIATKVSEETEALSSEILEDIEMGREHLSNVVLRVIRLAGILNDPDVQREFERMSSGYDPSAGRPKSIEKCEYDVAKGDAVLQGTYQGTAPGTALYEKKWILSGMDATIKQLASRRTRIHSYVANKHYAIGCSGLVNNVFERTRAQVDSLIGITVPDAVEKLVSAYNDLASNNPEDWSNAAHSCRRVLEALADAIFPPQDGTRTRNGTEVKLGDGQYIDRLMAYVDDSSKTKRYTEIVGSHLHYMGHRLDALFKAAQKGSHDTLTREEADRCVVYTYLLVGDILSLRSTPSSQ